MGSCGPVWGLMGSGGLGGAGWGQVGSDEVGGGGVVSFSDLAGGQASSCELFLEEGKLGLAAHTELSLYHSPSTRDPALLADSGLRGGDASGQGGRAVRLGLRC